MLLRRQGAKYGPAAQRERATRFAAAYGIRIVRIFQDLRSGRSARRDDFQRLLNELPESRVRVVIVAYASRWARDEFDGFATLKSIHDAAGCLVVADKALLSTDRERFTELAREFVEAAHYSRELSRNIRDGIAEKSKLHHDPWSHPLLGFRRGGANHTMRPDPRTMPTAMRAFELSAAGRSDQQIADELGVTLWRIRSALRSPLYAGRLADGRSTMFPAPVDPALWEPSQAERRRRAWSGHHTRHRVYPLSDRGPLRCDVCDRPLKGRHRRKPAAELRYYRHDEPCEAWPSAEVRTEVIEEQVAMMLDGARPNRESAARIKAALAVPPEGPDRLALARIDGRLRSLALELVAPDRQHPPAELIAEIESLQAERAEVAARSIDTAAIPADVALDYLNDLGRLWRETDDEGRRRLAVATFVNLGVRGVPREQLHDPKRPALARIVSVEATEYAERRGLAIALPTALEMRSSWWATLDSNQ